MRSPETQGTFEREPRSYLFVSLPDEVAIGNAGNPVRH